MVGDRACPRLGREGVASDRVRARTCFVHVCAPAGARCVWSNIAAVSAHQSSLLPAKTERERDAQRRAHARPPWPAPAPAASRARGPRAARRNARPTRTRPAACAPSLCRARLARIRQIQLEQGADNADDRIEQLRIRAGFSRRRSPGNRSAPCRTKRVVYVLSREYLTG